MSGSQTEKAIASLKRVQDFDVESLPQVGRLGENNFGEAVEPAGRLIRLFQQLPDAIISDFPNEQQQSLISQADSFYQLLNQVTAFDSKQSNAFEARNSLIQTVRNHYQGCFNQLLPMISYGSARQRDFTALDRDFRAAIQQATDSASEAMTELNDQKAEAQKILEDVRQVAAEQGVSQQAIYFQQEGNIHAAEVAKWQSWTMIAAGVLVLYAALTPFIHHIIPLLNPTSPSEAIQLVLSKVLVFAVLAYLLLLFAKNFLAHKHNAIVNRHRQNALLTFKSLADVRWSRSFGQPGG